jgi:AraC family transcriptional regulator of adaptative response/methylated-DNA-[protein]-cysteine methyltransferase
MQTSLDVRNPTASDPRWAAVVARDRRADGQFVYAVRTTGVYCRPSCGSRRPRFENVVFHDNADAAERAGFRPCRRCRPERRDDDPRAALIARLCRAIDAGDAPPLAGMAREAGLSGTQLRRLFRTATGLTPKAYGLAARARRLRDALPLAPSVTDAIQDAGFASSGHFHAQAAPMIGMSAQRFRRAGAGMQIRYSVGECSLGSILVAMTDRGVCAILIGDEPAPLLRDLQQRFANATLQGGDADFDATMASAIALVDEPGRGFDLPLDVRGTAFQHRVWQVLREIPAGETISYADLARRVGVPAAVRAVAQACAANPVAVAIPCHRVVRSDGTLSGYRWGVERKRALLAREAAKRDER